MNTAVSTALARTLTVIPATALIVTNVIGVFMKARVAGIGIVALGLPIYFHYSRRLPAARLKDWLGQETSTGRDRQ